VEVLVPLNDEAVLDVKYLPEEDVLALVAKSGSISIFDLNSSMVESLINDHNYLFIYFKIAHFHGIHSLKLSVM